MSWAARGVISSSSAIMPAEGENTLRALASDLAYLEGWAQAATGAPLPWPAPESLALKYVAHHLRSTSLSRRTHESYLQNCRLIDSSCFPQKLGRSFGHSPQERQPSSSASTTATSDSSRSRAKAHSQRRAT